MNDASNDNDLYGEHDLYVHSLYQRELFGWAVNTVGKAVGWSLVAAFTVGLIGALSESLAVLSFAGLAGAVVFALKMADSRPPWPSDLNDSLDVHARDTQRAKRLRKSRPLTAQDTEKPPPARGEYRRSPEHRTNQV